MKDKYRFETKAIHAGQVLDETGSRALPLYQTTAYVFDSPEQGANRFALTEGGNIYSRITNPTQSVFEARLAELEGGSAGVATASGMAAISYALQALAKQGDHIVSTASLYGGTSNLFLNTFPERGIEVSLVDTDNIEDLEGAFHQNTKALFVESIGNPKGNVEDLEALAELAHKHGVPLLVDNTFATPYLLRPIEFGADIVVHSATKFLNGHGTSVAGVVVESGKFDWAKDNKYPHLTEPNDSYHGLKFLESFGGAAITTYIRAVLLRDTGASISPFNAWLTLQGIESLPVRMDRHVANAEKIARYLHDHDKVEEVHYAGLKDSPYYERKEKYLPKGASSIFTFELKGGAQAAKKFIEHLQIFSLLANVGDSKSLVAHPASTTHSQSTEEELLAAGISQGTIRLSVGIENVEDLLEDIDQALAVISS